MLISPGSATGVAPDDEPVIELICMLARFYVFASRGAVRRGRSPDAPPMLSKITETR
jgi:fructoselysine-6-P-deglycase FrlB-like protein